MIDNQIVFTKPVWEKNVYYKVRARNNTQYRSIFTDKIKFTGKIGVPDRSNKEEVIENLEIAKTKISNEISNYPNPFNPTTKIEYSIKESSNVKIVVYDMLGQEIKTLVNSEKSAGTHSVNFDGSSLPSGIYYCKIVSTNFNKTIKMLLTK
ncbi:MAG: T9SS type A sorting domain-containing protein [Rhodothermaceae bacterium]